MLNESNNFIKAGVIYVFGSFFAQGLRFITLPVFSRLMTPEDYGYIASYELWISVITIFVGLQAYATVNNAYLDFGRKQIDRYAAAISAVGFISTIILCILTLLFGNVLANIFELSIKVLIIGILQCYFTYIIFVISAKYRMLEKVYSFLAFSVSKSLLNVLLSYIFVILINENKYIGYIGGLAFSNLLVGIIAVILVYVRGKCIFNREMTKYALKISSPLMIHNLSSVILGRVNQIILLKMIGATEAGLYNFGNNFAFIINALYTAFNQAYVPWYYKQLYAHNVDIVIKCSKAYIQLFTEIAGALILVIPEVIILMSTEEYYAAIDVVPIVMAGMYVNYIYTFCVNYEIYNKKTKYVAICTVVTAVINVLLNLVLVAWLGLQGAGIATLLSMIVLFILHYIIAKNIIGNFELDIAVFLPGFAEVFVVCIAYYFLRKQIIIRWLIAISLACVALIRGIKFVKEMQKEG